MTVARFMNPNDPIGLVRRQAPVAKGTLSPQGRPRVWIAFEQPKLDRIGAEAQRRGVSVSEMIRQLCEQALPNFEGAQK